jgi:tubulin alpha
MREIISLHIGQSGIQIGSLCWKLFCLEHGIQKDATLNNNNNLNDNDCLGTFFSQNQLEEYESRCLFIDTEPSAIHSVKNSQYARVFNSEKFINDKRGSSGSYSRGYCSNTIEQILEALRKQTENCSNLQGFLIYHSLGGGTGSGLTSLLQQKLSNEYDKKTKINIAIYPDGPLSSGTIEPYNSILATHATMDHSDCMLLFDNKTISNICHRNLSIERPQILNINQVISQVVSSLTSSMRFDGNLNLNLNEVVCNLVPYKRAHFLSESFAPLTSKNDTTLSNETPHLAQLTYSALQTQTQLVNCDVERGKYMGCTLMCHGDVVPKDISATVSSIKPKVKINFVDWHSCGTKFGILHKPPVVFSDGDLGSFSRSVCVLSNSTAIGETWTKLRQKFDSLYSKRAFVHWYLNDGIAETEFKEARDDLVLLEDEYKEMAESLDENEEDQ